MRAAGTSPCAPERPGPRSEQRPSGRGERIRVAARPRPSAVIAAAVMTGEFKGVPNATTVELPNGEGVQKRRAHAALRATFGTTSRSHSGSLSPADRGQDDARSMVRTVATASIARRAEGNARAST
jgi:hypothetical protein